MKVLLVLSILIIATSALPIDDDEVKPEILRNEFTNNFDKGYHFA